MPSSTGKSQLLSRIVSALSLLYPVLVLVGLRYLPPAAIVGALGAVLALRLALGNRGSAEAVLGIAVAITIAMLWISPMLAVRLYPVLMSLGFATLFLHSLWSPPVMIERFARLAEPDLPEAARPYLRKVTIAWITFLLANATVAAWTVLYGTIGQWTLYNGFISYLLMGAMFGGEYLVRQRVRPAP
jgi:uncharacterized membrane protein